MNKSQLLSSLKAYGYSSEIIKSFNKVPREDFISRSLKNIAYEDIALPLENGATISQPYTIAFMLQLLELKPKQKILEIGSGSGYVLALLHNITKGEIYGVEIIKSLAKKSRKYLSKYKDVKVFSNDGSRGLKEKEHFDRILISASSKKVPEFLFSQLKENGIMVAPVNESIIQIKKNKGRVKLKEHYGFVFVPLKTNSFQR
jgi:protein-L-isoaspartate(D-aspartate) O-methyltransferase